MKMISQTAIVIGASMGGLLAARALADYYEQVILLERDIFPKLGNNRKGVPQERHSHALLFKGREALEQFFPGLTRELQMLGALSGDIRLFSRWFVAGGYLQKSPSGLIVLLVSRPLLETQVRRRLLSLANVKAIENCNVVGLVTTPDNSRITGVRFIRLVDGSAEEVLNADLVVDATGRGSRSMAWLETLGYQKPQEERVNVGIGYTTRIYRRKPEHLQGDAVVVVSASAPDWRCAVMLAQESDRWTLSMGGYLNDHAPTDPSGFLEFAKSLPTQDIYEVIKDAEPLSELLPYKFPSSQRRHYEKLQRFPEGYLVFGDAICSFNPIYGQGMTVAALEAVALQDCLAKGANNLPRRFFLAASKVVDIPWSIAVGNDLRNPRVEGQRSPMMRFINWYVSKLQIAAQRDAVLAMKFFQVANLIISPQNLLHPKIAFRVLLGNISRDKAAKSFNGNIATTIQV